MPLDHRYITTYEKVSGKWMAISDTAGEIK
jgi:hypothetical protein